MFVGVFPVSGLRVQLDPHRLLTKAKLFTPTRRIHGHQTHPICQNQHKLHPRYPNRISHSKFHNTRKNIRYYSDYRKMKEDYYSVLGVPKTATAEEIKAAYEVLKRKWDPNLPSNKNPRGKEIYQNIEEAYEILKDEKKRISYDKFGHSAVNFNGIDMETLFDNFRSTLESSDPWSETEPTTRDYARGQDIALELTLSLEESVNGAEKTMIFKAVDTCHMCKGVGASEPNYAEKTCPSCNGAGMTKEGKGLFQAKLLCKDCDGLKTLLEPSCKLCKGEGVIPSKRKIKIQVPPGVNTNHQLRFHNKGDIGSRNSGKNGDLYVAFKILEHPIFAREKGNIHVKQPITLGQAVLGGKIKIPTIQQQTIEAKIPSCTQPGDQLVLSEMGIKEHGKYLTGDIIIHWDIVVPKKVTKKQEDILWLFGGTAKRIKPPNAQLYSSGVALYERVKFFFTKKLENEKKKV